MQLNKIQSIHLQNLQSKFQVPILGVCMHKLIVEVHLEVIWFEYALRV